MASPCEHGSARIKVQVVATLVSLDVPVHVNSFWTLVKFSETPKICNVEDSILRYLNSMARKCPIEIVVHDLPITPSWTYVPVTSSSATSNLHQPNGLSNSISADKTSTQEITVLLKPPVSDCGKKKLTKPPRPILMSYNISDSLPKSTRLIFMKQLVFMQDSVLLADSKSDILRDNDVIVINAICAFFTVETFDNSLSLNHETDFLEAEVKLSGDTLKDVDKHCLMFDIDEDSNSDIGVELIPEIKTKFDTILQKLASLKYSHKSDKCVKKSKKRKLCKEDSGTELSNSISADTVKDNHREQRQKNKSVGEQLAQDHNQMSATDEADVFVSKSKKRSKKKKRSENENGLFDPIDTHVTDEIVSIPQTGFHLNERIDETQGCLASDMQVSVQSMRPFSRSKKRKPPSDFGLSNLLGVLRNQQAMEVSEDNHKEDLMNKVAEKQVEDDSAENLILNVSITDKKIKKKKSEVEVGALDLVSRSFTADIVEQPQIVSNHDARAEVGPQNCPAPGNQAYTPSVNTISTSKRRKPTGFGLSNLLCALRNQQNVGTHEENNKTDLINVENESEVDGATDNTATNTSITVKQLDSSQTKRKRVRKRKNKKSNVSASSSLSKIPDLRERDYTLKLAENHMPQNCRVTFDGDSGDEQVNQIAFVAQSTSLLNQHKQFHTQKSFTENSSPKGEGTLISANDSTAVDVAKTSLNKEWAAINPDEKFKALLKQCGTIGRQFETISSTGGHAVIRGLRQKRNKFKMADAVDPERDVLTNVSTITKQEVKAESSASRTSGYIDHKPSASGDNKKFPPPQILEMLPTTRDRLLSNNYVLSKLLCKKLPALPLLHGLPLEGDIIAYKILELSSDYTPGLSNFKEAKVINVNTQAASLLLELRGRKDNEQRMGRFEMTIDVTDGDSTEDASLVTVELADLVDTRLVHRPHNQ